LNKKGVFVVFLPKKEVFWLRRVGVLPGFLRSKELCYKGIIKGKQIIDLEMENFTNIR